ncbi:hydantoinase/oxoprolinase family protein [Pectobacterium versatile]|uniref:hydantoinase/oxoprolinase family protein n=1 Tax=Pectobacterium versatile TaxID=2488639 RepID=UPI000CDE99A9|nr:hydantoinase/oxoprolinase family protein [Pectobacterium versatile]MBQ4792748.1 hydantoinase/oxoprolinase family protein [Pectobacterium versatile]POY59548.1 hydantoinase subunit beta [Pectobacterium versatile]POY64980.1 hydantoinase subunit beta [Pectobacterium versatile]TAI95994.1 hydantoinase/oxoprolinase family protein [Pectobacterium versatile]UEQ09293.1 hydantoinase/oxoprolinase family protein [Pectobacterium versatile]
MLHKNDYRLGIDVGGTNTDAAILDADLRCIATAKFPTSLDIYSGIERVIAEVLAQSGIAPQHIRYAMLGTTQCTNAIVERKGLDRVGLLRLSLPSSDSVPPLFGWDDEWQRTLGEHFYQIHGGYEFDGREIHSVLRDEVLAACDKMRGHVDSVAICGVFSPVNNQQELQVAQWVSAALPAVSVSLSHRIGSTGLLERENATILNASLQSTANRFVNGFTQALVRHGIEATPFFGQNDGTLMSESMVKQYPILTMACGPTNSIRGACHLSGLDNALIIDVGGTTTDIGVLVNGFPRESAIAVEVGDVRTNFRMPDIISIGIGGGTCVRQSQDGKLTLGPDSVGYRLLEQGVSFGGETLTLSDIMLQLHRERWIADLPRPLPKLDNAFCQQAYRQMIDKVESAIDRIKSSSAAIPAVLVGGGSILLPDVLSGVSQVMRPQNFDAANAVGVALGAVGAQIERVVKMPDNDREKIKSELQQQTICLAEEMGARPGSVEIIDYQEIPLAYLPGNSVQVKIKAAGNLA